MLTTPQLLRETLGYRRTKIHNGRRLFSLKKDLLLTYPPEEFIEEFQNNVGIQVPGRSDHQTGSPSISMADRDTKPDLDLQSYQQLRGFSTANKSTQRRFLREYGIPVPAAIEFNGRHGTFERVGRTGIRSPVTGVSGSQLYGHGLGLRDFPTHVLIGPHQPEGSDRAQLPARYVVRPLSHYGGQGYRITEDPTDWDPSKEYISELFPKRHEYRLLYWRGQLVSTLLKRVPAGIDRDGPWNHTNGSSFVSVNNPDLDRLRHTDVYERLRSVPIIKCATCIAVDILLGKRDDGYVVCEFNFSPGITIPSTLERIKSYEASLSP